MEIEPNTEPNSEPNTEHWITKTNWSMIKTNAILELSIRRDAFLILVKISLNFN